MRVWMMAAALLFATQASAAEIKGTSRVDAVTVFPRGAEVVRLVKVRIEKGAHTVVLSDLPVQALPRSIRVKGTSSGELQIGAVDVRRIFVFRNDDDASGRERKLIEADIERLKDELSVLNSEVATKNIQKKFIENLAALPTQPVASGQGSVRPGVSDWTGIFDLIGGRLADVRAAIHKTMINMRQVKRQLGDLEKKLALWAPSRVQRTEIKINVTAGQALSADMVVSYQVREARWVPLYDARLQTGSKNVPAKLVLTRRAAVVQKTDEKWEGVRLSLSTTRPSGRSSIPILRPLKIDFARPAPPPKPVALESDSYRKRSVRAYRTKRKVEQARASAPAMVRAVKEQVAQVQQMAFQAIFKVPDLITIGNAGNTKRVKISDMELEPALVVRAVPKRDAKAYLYAKLKLPRTAPYLSGQVALFRDQVFVGHGRLPRLAAGESHEIGFGADDLVRIKYKVTGEKRGETGLISSSRTDQRKFKITIKNLHERPIAYSILDQVPVSLEDTIRVVFKSKTPPTKKNVKDKRGILAWEGKLGADGEKVFEFDFTVSWPTGKKIEYR